MSRAPFLCLDGLDGTGKSAQCRMLVDWLNASGVPATGCADPGGTPLGDQLRGLLLGSRTEMADRAEALLFMASRAELVAKVIRPNLEAGRVVVSDRFVMSNVVYQGHAGGLPTGELWAIGHFSTGGLMPDLTLVLDLPVERAVARRGRAADRMESRGDPFLERVRAGFLAEAGRTPDRVFVVDASPDLETVQHTLRGVISPLLQQRGFAIEAGR